MFDTHYTRADFSIAAEHYDAHATLQHKVRACLLEKARAQLPVCGKVLDAGCGTGLLANALQGYDITAVDMAYGMCKQAAESNSLVVCAPVETLPFADASFDMVFSSLVLQWVGDLAGALTEMRRVLKRGGVLAVSYLCEGTLRELRESFAACDDYPHISDFPPSSNTAEVITEYYPDVHALMQYLKTIGARNKHHGRRKSLMTPKQFKKVESYYRKHFATPAGMAVTWNVQYMVEVKA